jgi:hypothetical protein
MQIAPGDLVLWLFVVGGLAAFAGIFYFVWAGLKRDHATGEYDFTWGVAIVALFLMGFAPGLVGVGLYLTIDRGYPLYVLVGAAFLGLAVFVVLGWAVSVQTVEAGVVTVMGLA